MQDCKSSAFLSSCNRSAVGMRMIARKKSEQKDTVQSSSCDKHEYIKILFYRFVICNVRSRYSCSWRSRTIILYTTRDVFHGRCRKIRVKSKAQFFSKNILHIALLLAHRRLSVVYACHVRYSIGGSPHGFEFRRVHNSWIRFEQQFANVRKRMNVLHLLNSVADLSIRVNRWLQSIIICLSVRGGSFYYI